MVAIWFVFFVTFVIFPGAFFLSHLDFMHKLGKQEFTYYSLIMILAFNVCDTIGRKLGGSVTSSAQLAMLLSLLRFVFIFTTCFIAKKELDTKSILETDTFKVINVVLFALTNGYVSTCLAILAPTFVEQK